jgi:hypothetical protein
MTLLMVLTVLNTVMLAGVWLVIGWQFFVQWADRVAKDNQGWDL